MKTIAKTLTPSQVRALRWLADHGGSGVIDQYGRVVASGEIAKFDGSTWLRLASINFIDGGDARLSLSDAGRLALAQRESGDTHDTGGRHG